MPKKVKTILYIILFLIILNTGFSIYLAYEFYFPDPTAICAINSIFNCVTVAESGYAVLFGIPIAIWGIAFYLGLFVLTLGLLLKIPFFTTDLLFHFLRFLVYFGVAFSFALTYIEAFVIRVYCPFCLAQQAVIIVVAILLIWAKKPMNKAKKGV
jgi:uncharacterized membrane protein